MSSSTHRRALRAGSVLTVAAAAVLLGAAPAFAHVTAQPGEAEQGGYTVINMRVPNESDTAGTIKLEITLPAEHPITGVRTTPVPGWTATMVKAPLAQPIESHGRTITEAVRTVTLDRNPGTRIGPGEFVEFPALARSAAHRHRPAGDPGGPDLRRRRGRRVGPAPDRRTRVGTPGSDGPPDPGEPTEVAAAPVAAAAVDQAPPGGDDPTARWLGGAGLLLGALGLGFGVGAMLRTRRAEGRADARACPAPRRRADPALRPRAAARRGAGAGAHPADRRRPGRRGEPRHGSRPRLADVQREHAGGVHDGDGARPRRSHVGTGQVGVDGPTVGVDLRPLGPAGAYQVGYRVVSDDGHPVTGAITFTLTAPGPGAAVEPAPAASAAPPAAAAATAAPAESGGGAPVWPWIVGAVLLVGGGVFAALRLGR